MTVNLAFSQPITVNISGRGHTRRVDAITGMTSSQAQGIRDEAAASAASSQTSADAAAQSAADADAAVLLAQQAQAAAYNVPDVAMRDIINNPVTETVGALKSYSRARETHVVPTDHGVVGDGVADDSSALTTAANAAASARKTLALPGAYRAGTNMALSTDTLVIDGQSTGELLIDADGGIRVEPSRTSVGTTAAAVAVGATTVTVTGAAWTADEHVGKWAIITDPAINPVSGDGTAHSRRVTTNTADTLTLDEQIGYPIPAGCTVEVATPLKSITLRNITLRRTTPGGADLRISYVDEVVLDNVTSIDAGTMGADRGNGISVYHASRVRVTDATMRNPGNFGIFIYHSRDVKVDRCTVVNPGGQFGMQLKDCTSSVISRGLVEGAQESSYNLKCSGLNEATDVQLVDSVSVGSVLGGIELSSITAEGSLSGHRFAVSATAVVGSGGSGLTVITDAGTDPATTATWKLNGCSVRDAANVAYSITAPGIQLESCDASGCQFEAALVTSDDVRIVGGEFRDNCLGYTTGASRSSEIRSDAARLSVTGTTFVRTAAGKSLRAHRDTASASLTLLRDTVIRDTTGTLVQDYILSATSKAVGMHTLDVLGPSTTVSKIDPTA